MRHTLQVGDYAMRNDNRRRVEVLEIRPREKHTYYLVQDCHDGHVALADYRELTLWESKEYREDK